MTIKPIFKSPDSDEYGQFCVLRPYPTNKEVCAAKRLMRDSMVLFGPLKDVQWIVGQIDKDDQGNEVGIVGWRAVAVKPPFNPQGTSVGGVKP